MATATELIEKDDMARDILGLPKPSLMDFKDMNVKETLLKREIDEMLFKLGIGDDPGVATAASRVTKRP